MTSEPIRDPRGDHLLTPQNCALVIIDYQPTQVTSIRSMDQDVLVDHVVHLARFGMLYLGYDSARGRMDGACGPEMKESIPCARRTHSLGAVVETDGGGPAAATGTGWPSPRRLG